MTEMTPEARAMKNARAREYYKQHPEKSRERQNRYWNRQAEKAAAAAAGNFDVAEARIDNETESRAKNLVNRRKKLDKRTDPEKISKVDAELSRLKSDSRRK